MYLKLFCHTLNITFPYSLVKSLPRKALIILLHSSSVIVNGFAGWRFLAQRESVIVLLCAPCSVASILRFAFVITVCSVANVVSNPIYAGSRSSCILVGAAISAFNSLIRDTSVDTSLSWKFISELFS